MTERHTVIPRNMCFVFHGREVLLIKASEKKDWAGMYDPIGGHIEKGESIIDSANREIREESGLRVTGTKLRGIVHVTNFFGKDIMLFITASIAKSKKVVGSYEGEPEWVNFEDLDKIKVFEDVKPILKHVVKMRSDELFVGTSEFDGKDKLLSLDIKIH
jgi:8-oxo-dGTP diphosphatase